MRMIAHQLKSPRCLLQNGSPVISPVTPQQLLRHGVYDASRLPQAPEFLFVFPHEYQQQANQLFRNLKTGNNLFPGLERLFKIPISNETVHPTTRFDVERLSPSEIVHAYETAINEYIQTHQKPDFAFVLCEKTQRWQHPSPYFVAKSLLTAHGIASQIVTVDLLQNTQQLTWSLSNIALQTFVKMGGHPWSVVPSGGAGDVILGIGRSERVDEKTQCITRYVGYTTCFTAGGLFRSVEVFKPAATRSTYLDGLYSCLSNAISRVIAEGGNAPTRLVLHVPKRFSYDERERVEAALRDAQQGLEIQYVVLRLADEHPFKMFDLNQKTYAPSSGISVELDSKNRIVVLEGRPIEKAMRKPIPSPLWVTLQTASSSSTEFDALVQQIYELAIANWRGFNSRANPITIHYSELVADILSAIADDDIVQQIADNPTMREVPWFV